MKMTINDLTLNYKIQEDGRCLPNSPEILEQVGLSGLSDEISQFYDLLEFSDPKELFKWVSYHADVNVFQAKARITKYLLLDCGCRMCFGATENIRVEEFNWLRLWLSGIEDEKIFTFDEISEMLNKIGFDFTLIHH